jgi:HEAT repeat protein
MSEGSSRLRAAGGRALGSIGATAGIPVLLDCLENRDWRVRLSAAKALGKIKDFQPSSQMLACLVDRNPRVRSAATCALRRHGRLSNSFVVRG